MSKKSAASAKVIKPEFKEEHDPREEFDKFKELQIITMKAAVDQSKRIDTWVSMRNDLGGFLNREPSIEEVNEFYEYEKTLLLSMLDILVDVEFETLNDPGYADIYAELLIDPEDCHTLEEYFKAYLTWCTVKPWAENLFNLNRAIVNGTAE